jgi:hypothetical protein
LTSTCYLKTLKDRFRHYYDIHENTDETQKLGVDLIATFFLRGEKHMLTKNIKLYALEEYEHCMVRVFHDKVTLSQAEAFAERINQSIEFMVRPHPDHKRTILTGVMVAEQGCDEAVCDFAAKYRSQRVFQFYMKGWCEIRLVLVNLQDGRVTYRADHNSRHLGRMYMIPDAT